MVLLTQRNVEKGKYNMDKLLNAIKNSKLSKQEFANMTHISYQRIATILYGQSSLTDDEESEIIAVLGKDIFLP